MFAKIFVICTLASLACAGYLRGYSSYDGTGDVNSKYQSSWPTGYSNVGRYPKDGAKGWNARRISSYPSPSLPWKDSNVASNGWVGNNYNAYNRGYAYNGAATSQANSNLQSYGGSSAYGKQNGYNEGGYSYPRYSFSYGVNDLVTGDQKYQQEQRDGDRVQGRYGLKEPDGTTRSVDYVANDRDGFNAVVIRSGVARHPY